LKPNDNDKRFENVINRLDLAGQIGFIVGVVLLGLSVVMPTRPGFAEADPRSEMLTLVAAALTAGSLVMILGTMAVRFKADWETAPWRISLRALVVLVTVVAALFGAIVFAVRM
jgi:hypothetical protein